MSESIAKKKNPRPLTSRELATVLHGLRMIQCEGRIEGCNAGMCEHFEGMRPLTNPQIDRLCERLNFTSSNPQGDIEIVEPPARLQADVPPDPEDINDDRAAWALTAVKTFGDVTGECFDKFEDQERTEILAQNISDFLADLAHLCDREGIELRERLSVAQEHYNEETENKGEQWMAETDEPSDPEDPFNLKANGLS